MTLKDILIAGSFAGGSDGGLTDAVKQAILMLAQKVAYTDPDAEECYNALHDAFYPPEGLQSISAVYTQSGTVYDSDDLDDLKTDLVVTAAYADGTTSILSASDYTLSGALVVGTSTITVLYGNKTATFDVLVSHGTGGALYYWDLTSSLIDEARSNTAIATGAVQTSSGLSFSNDSDVVKFPDVYGANRRIEIDVTSIDRQGFAHGRFIIYNRGSLASPSLDAGFMYRMSQQYWAFYGSTWITTSFTDSTIFDNKTVVVELDANKVMTVKVDNTTIVSSGSAINIAADDNTLYIGSNEKALYNMTITGLRVYEVS